jgi:hypothetical protein
VVSGGVLIFMGGELNHFARIVVQVVLVISFIIAPAGPRCLLSPT